MIGRAVVKALRDRGDEVVVLSRDADSASAIFGGGVDSFSWQPSDEPAPSGAAGTIGGTIGPVFGNGSMGPGFR